MNYDVVVVGAGPAGSATARDIARAGFKVLMVEKRKAVGKPAFCSGLVTPRTLEVAGASDGLILNEIKGAVVHSLSGTRLNLGGAQVYALAIDRAALDVALAQQAQEARANLLLGTKLVGIEREDGHLRLVADRHGKTQQVTTKILIGADGVGSLVARWMGTHESDGVVRAIAVEGQLGHGEVDHAQVFVGSSVAPGWFGWVIPLGGGRVRIGTGDGNHARVSLNQLLKNMVAAFPRQLREIRVDRIWTKAIPLYAPMRTYGDNVLLVGDAARQVKPTSGGGIYTGLMSAKHCARVAIRALKKEDFSATFLCGYLRTWQRDVGAELDRGIDLRRAFLSLEDQEIDKLLSLLGIPFLQPIISRFGDIDSPSFLAERLVQVMPVLRLFLHVPLLFPVRWRRGPGKQKGN
jgi:geranylgeranyl reductase family protein